jgi:hypothetical protein
MQFSKPALYGLPILGYPGADEVAKQQPDQRGSEDVAHCDPSFSMHSNSDSNRLFDHSFCAPRLKNASNFLLPALDLLEIVRIKAL